MEKFKCRGKSKRHRVQVTYQQTALRSSIPNLTSSRSGSFSVKSDYSLPQEMYRNSLQLSRQFINSLNYLNNSVFLVVNSESHTARRWAGHSKWQNIKSTKQAADRIKSTAFGKLSRQIEKAVKDGGDNMATNQKLKALWAEAQKLNMPKASFENRIKGAKNRVGEKPFWAIFSGPKGIVLGFEVLFMNKSPGFIQGTFGPQLKKLKFKFEPHFQELCIEKGIILSHPLAGVENVYEKAVEDAIEIGVNEVILEDDKTLIFECLPDRVDSIQQRLESKGYDIFSASRELEFKEFITISKEEEKDLESIINKCKNLHAEIIRATYNVTTP